MAEIVLEGVTKVFPDGTEAVRSLDLEVPDGSLMVLVGPSGCGKTTVLRMVAGLEEATDGIIRIGDRVVNDVEAKNRDLAMVFQNYALYPHMSVHDNMAFGLKLRRTPRARIEESVGGAAKMLSLVDKLKKKPGQLSGGQRQRVAMGRAIVRQPQAYLMDEPLSNLDAKLRVQTRTEISRLQRELGVTTVYVTHDQTEAMTMGDSVAVMKKGELQQLAGPQVLYERPANVFVAGFIGSPAMNMVEATLVVDGGAPFVEFAGFRLRVDEEAVRDAGALRAFHGRTVALGVRPEDFEDARFVTDAPDDRRIRVLCDVREAMGAEVFVHFALDAPPVLTEDTKELAADAGDEALEELAAQAGERRSRFVARVNPRTRAREGEPVELVVDTRDLHFFDPETGERIDRAEP
ncbi:MAG: sn-glycerol-3-phosphate ABC transporter ATP-binding protein UgpC [Thermoleophilia bacterium]|nr:sn-glycerol-3-phosphate ABC transporter ATP-binding protein UgpC [Thermoleophilia bacterium]